MAHSFTKEQQAAIDTRDKTLLVSAAAGSGKTATLTQRIIASLLDEENPADISELLIVTFTNAAVGELKERIGKAIRDRLAEQPQNQRLQRQLLLLPSATICTIDAFCNEVLRENTGAVGIPPNYRIADVAEAELLGGAVCESLIAAAYEGDLGNEISAQVFAELCDALTRVKEDSALTSIFLGLYRKCETHERGVYSLRDLQKEYDPGTYTAPENTRLGAYIMQATTEMAAHYANALQRLLSQFPLEGKEATALHAILSDEQYRLYHLSKTRTYEELREGLAGFVFARQPAIRAEAKTAQIESAIRLRKEYKEAIGSYHKKFFLYTTEQYGDLYTNLYKYSDTLCAFLEKFDFLFREEKARRGLCEYADIERYAYRCLWDGDTPSAYARELSEKYSAVYIDEYQDVNRLQNLVFEAVSRPNNRFMVGDIKQSIYSFRSADPSIFADMKNTYPPLEKAGRSHAASIFMSQNFRCDAGVVDFVNRVFDTVFGLLGESIGYVPQDRLCFSKLPPVGDHFPEITLVSALREEDGDSAEDGEESIEEEESSDAVEAEARAVGKKILSLLDGEKKNDGSPIRPGDIAVIFRALRAKAPIYTRVFASMGIDCAVGDDRNLLLAPEVLLCLCLLNSIDNPHRDIYLAGLLCSPLYGFSADDLVRYRRAEGAHGESLFAALNAYAAAHPEDARLSAFLSSLARYQLMAEGMQVDALLTKLYAESSLLSLAAKNGGRDNLLLLKDYAARYEAGGFSGLYSFIHYINNLLENRTDFDSKRPSAADESRVQLITVHSSKGLEYPVCFLAGCGGELRDKESGPFAYVEGFGLALRLRDRSGLSLVENPAVNAVARRRFEKSFEEELRILYVALTRARERLYLFGTLGKTQAEDYLARVEEQIPYLDAYSMRRMHSFLKIALASSTGAAVHIERESGIPSAEQTPEEAVFAPSALPLCEADVSRFVSRFTYAYAHENLASVPRKLSVSALKPSLLDEKMKAEADPTEEERDPYLQRARAEESEEEEQTSAPMLPRFMTGKREEESARRGIATHLFLQFCDFAALSERGAETELDRLIREKFISEEDGARVRLGEIEKFRKSRLLREILDACRLHREMRFHARMPAALFTESEEKRGALGAHRILVQGVIDCLYEDERGCLTLIDYKTDRLPREALADPLLAAEILSKKHREQLSYYAIAVEQMFGKRPDRIRVYSLHLGDTVEIEPLKHDFIKNCMHLGGLAEHEG